jgi:VWFA-related protein
MAKIRPHFAFLGLLVLVCLAESKVAAGQMKPAPPNSQVNLSTFGYSGLSPINRFTERFNLSLSFVDSDHLLFTFNAHGAKGLLERRPDCAPTNSCHQIRAIVIDLRNNGVTAEADWYLYDYRRYLWSLGNGRFLLRRSNSIFLVGSDLQEKLLYSSPDDLLWCGLTADRKQLILESRFQANTNKEQHEQNPSKVKIEFRDVDSLAVQKAYIAPAVVEMASLSSGYADSIHNPVRQTWLVRFGDSESKRKDLMQVKSPCKPDLLFPTDKTLLVGRCSMNNDAYSVSVFTLGGHPLWRQQWSQHRFDPAVLSSDDGSRIVVSTITANRDAQESAPSDDKPGWADVEQEMRVLEAATGVEILETGAKTAFLKNENYSLSPDGRRFAVVDGTKLNLFDLPPMKTEERTRYVAMNADAPDLDAPGASSGDVAAPDSQEQESVTAEKGPASDLAAPVRTQNRAQLDLSNASGQGAKPADSASPSPIVQDAAGGQNPTTFSVRVEEVTVDVAVTDSKGLAVKGLSKDDFQVKENEVPQELASFHEYGNSTIEPSKPVASAPTPSNVFNNNSNTTADQPMVVILLDYLNTQIADQQDAIRQLTKFMRTKPAGTKFALFLMTERLEMLQGFTADENLLLATLGSKSARPRISSELQKMDMGGMIEGYKQAAQSNPDLERTVQNLTNSQAVLDASQLSRRAAITTDGFAALANYLKATPGRKSLIWLSGSFPLTFIANENSNVDTANLSPVVNTYSDLVRNTANLLAEAHIAVYPVNARGLAVDVLPGMDENPNPSTIGLPGSGAPAIAHVSVGGTNQASSIAAPSALDQRVDELKKDRLSANEAMDQVASETGGKAFQNTNDLTLAMQTAADLSSHYYLLSYSPKKQTHDGAFRSLKVLLAKKGYHVAYRRGYYAAGKQTASAKSDLKVAINSAAMEQGLPQAQQMVFSARVVPVGKPRKAANPPSAGNSGAKERLIELQRYSVDYAIAASELRFGAKGVSHTSDLVLMAVAFGEKGAVLSQYASEAATTLNTAAFKDTQIGGLRTHQEFEVPASAASMRLGIVDVLSGHLGTLELPLPLSAPPEETRVATRHLPPIEPN